MASFGHLLSRTANPAHGSSRGEAEQPGHAGSTLHFLRHFGEMVLAMVAGMMILGAVDRGILAAAGTSVPDLRDSAPEVVALVMAFNMTVGMAVWMRHRGHSWARVEEMGSAMFIPAIAAIVLFWFGLIDSDAILPLEHIAMFPAMVVAMLLHPSDYSRPVRSHGPRAAG